MLSQVDLVLAARSATSTAAGLSRVFFGLGNIKPRMRGGAVGDTISRAVSRLLQNVGWVVVVAKRKVTVENGRKGQKG